MKDLHLPSFQQTALSSTPSVHRIWLGYIIRRSPCTPHSIYLRGTIRAYSRIKRCWYSWNSLLVLMVLKGNSGGVNTGTNTGVSLALNPET